MLLRRYKSFTLLRLATDFTRVVIKINAGPGLLLRKVGRSIVAVNLLLVEATIAAGFSEKRRSSRWLSGERGRGAKENVRRSHSGTFKRAFAALSVLPCRSPKPPTDTCDVKPEPFFFNAVVRDQLWIEARNKHTEMRRIASH